MPPTHQLPPEEDRYRLLRWVMAAAASRCVSQVGFEKEEAGDDSDDSTGKSPDAQDGAYEYKKRLQSFYGKDLFHFLSKCLELPASKNEHLFVPTSPNIENELEFPEDAVSCIALLLYNTILSIQNEKKSQDARVRTVIEIACIHILEKSMDWETIQLPKVESGELFKGSPNQQLDGEEDWNQLLDSYFDEIRDESTNLNKHFQKIKKLQETEARFRLVVKKFAAIEEAVVENILFNMVASQQPKPSNSKTNDPNTNPSSSYFTRVNIIRSLKIGSVGAVAGTLFAVTGGMAAPGIAAGMAALGIGGAATGTLLTGSTFAALFGLGGGGLSVYKMKRRTDGLQEFQIQHPSQQDREKVETTAVVCISGWLRDKHDFQRPWGITPTDPPLTELELLQRFFSVYDPDQVDGCKELLDKCNGNSVSFWRNLQEKYGRDPDHLLPLKETHAMVLNDDETKRLRDLLQLILKQPETTDSPHFSKSVRGTSNTGKNPPLLHKSTLSVWDYQAEYSGDLHTLTWESDILVKMCNVVNAMIKEVTKEAKAQVLKRTALATIMAAVAWPKLLLEAADMIDGEWTLVILRADMAGVELAKSLLYEEDHRPVKLVGFSFGARIIHSCLQELAKHQQIWEDQQKMTKKKASTEGVDESQGEGSNESPSNKPNNYSREPASIIADVVLMGAPLYPNKKELQAGRRMVAGRFINCYSRRDWILSLMFQYQTSSGLLRTTYGTAPIEGVHDIDNYDVTHLVSSSHKNYCSMVPIILKLVSFGRPIRLDSS